MLLNGLEFGEFSLGEEVGVVEVGELVEVDLVETFGGLEGLVGGGVGEGLLELEFFGKRVGRGRWVLLIGGLGERRLLFGRVQSFDIELQLVCLNLGLLAIVSFTFCITFFVWY